MTVVVRGASDADVFATIHRAAFASAAWSATMIAESLAAGARGYLAAGNADDPPSGVALARFAGEEAEILTIGVEPAVRRRGLARALMRAACDDGRTAGATEMLLEVAEDNAEARALYAALEFRQVGARPFYYKRGRLMSVDALILRRSLSEPAK
ncbi:MAG: GNAT family N-acetyltransferase [Pseudomonadota bacterium]